MIYVIACQETVLARHETGSFVCVLMTLGCWTLKQMNQMLDYGSACWLAGLLICILMFFGCCLLSRRSFILCRPVVHPLLFFTLPSLP